LHWCIAICGVPFLAFVVWTGIQEGVTKALLFAVFCGGMPNVPIFIGFHLHCRARCKEFEKQLAGFGVGDGQSTSE
jgi:hypothetical protein